MRVPFSARTVNRMVSVSRLVCLWAAALAFVPGSAQAQQDASGLRSDARAALRKAVGYYRSKVAVHGGYVYYTSLDLEERWGEGRAERDEIWVQPPGTPTVGLACLAAYEATGDDFYLNVARDAAEALVYGQLRSGGWTNSVDFSSKGSRAAQYRNGKGGGRRNNSTLDDGISQSALRLLMHADRALKFKHEAIHEAAEIGRNALLAAQFPNGGFPQVWTGPVTPQPVVPAAYPAYDWRTENRIKEYWTMYTLNDDLAGDVSDTLIDAMEIYKDNRYREALVRLGDFLILAQMPEPQPAWAQQYDYEMRPIWARKFEPPAVAGRESQTSLETLMKIYRHTGDRKYLEPIPRALNYLQRSLLPDGRLARYYELRTNKPLYMTRDYKLTFDDSMVPEHYGWKSSSHLQRIEAEYERLKAGAPAPADPAVSRPAGKSLTKSVRAVLDDLDDEGRWVSRSSGERLVGQPKFQPDQAYLSSEVFSRNVELLAAYLKTMP